MFCKKGVIRNFAKFTGKHQCQSLFFNKDAWGLQQVFPCEFCEISKNNFYYRTLLVAASIFSMKRLYKNDSLSYTEKLIAQMIWSHRIRNLNVFLNKNLRKKVFKNGVNFISSKPHWKISDFLKYFECKIRDCDQISFLILSKFKRINYITFFLNTFAFSTIWNHLWWFQG